MRKCVLSEIRKNCSEKKNSLLYNVLFSYCVTVMYNNLHMQYLLKTNISMLNVYYATRFCTL